MSESSFNFNPIESEPTWLQGKADQLIAKLEDMVGSLDQSFAANYHLILLSLTEPAEDSTLEQVFQWDRSCDLCGQFTQLGFPFYTGHLLRKYKDLNVCITFGVCLLHSGDFKPGELTELT